MFYDIARFSSCYMSANYAFVLPCFISFVACSIFPSGCLPEWTSVCQCHRLFLYQFISHLNPSSPEQSEQRCIVLCIIVRNAQISSQLLYY